MKAIWKYELGLVGKQFLQMPHDARILTVQAQNGLPTLWAVVDPALTLLEERCFVIVSTGYNFEVRDLTYIGTV